jgi:hypothetical protein
MTVRPMHADLPFAAKVVPPTDALIPVYSGRGWRGER